MNVTSIKQQLNRSDRFSVFIDGEYAFSLNGSTLLDSKLVKGQELTLEQIEELKQLSAADILYDQAARYASLRLRSCWEMSAYLQRKDASPTLTTRILNKLSEIGLLSDQKFAEAFIADRLRLRPTSRRKIILELHKKRVADDIIQQALGTEEETDDRSSLRAIITSKRKQSRYQDDIKLMQYLARQGFSYGDIKAALQLSSEENL